MPTFMKFNLAIFMVLFASFAHPAQAGLLDWLGVGEEKSDSSESNSSNVIDPSKGSVRIEMTMLLADGGELKSVDYCDFRKAQDLSCTVHFSGVRGLFPGPIYGAQKDVMSFKISRWPHAEDQINLQYNWQQNRSFALNDQTVDGPLTAFQKGQAAIQFVFAKGEGGGGADPSTMPKGVFFKIYPDDR